MSETTSFRTRLLAVGNRLQTINGVQASSSLQDAASLVISHIVAFATAHAGHTPIPGFTDEKKLVVGAIFLHIVGLNISQLLLDEDVQIDVKFAIAKAGMAGYHLLGKEKAAELLAQGNREFQSIISAGRTHSEIRDFLQKLEELIFLYVMSEDGDVLTGINKMYLSIADAHGERSTN